MKIAPLHHQRRLSSGTNPLISLKLMCAAWPISPNRRDFQFKAVPWTPTSTRTTARTSTAIGTSPCPATSTTAVGDTGRSTATKLTLGLCLSPANLSTATPGITPTVPGCCTPPTLRRVARPRPALRGGLQEVLQQGDRHQPGGDGRPEAPGERRRGVATQYCHVITAAVFVSSHIYLALLMY